MRARVIKMIATAVTVAVLILGIPSLFIGGGLVWQSAQHNLQSRTQLLGNMVERRIQSGDELTQRNLDNWVLGNDLLSSAYVRVNNPGEAGLVERGGHVGAPRMTASVVLPSGTTVRSEISAWPTILSIARLVAVFLAGIMASLAVGYWLALRGSRRISAPLIYLAAQAEQIGSGQVRARVNPSGIEEIDLVQEELVRTGERMAGRLAAERQLAANASHQLRTPLTALSMRLEEIDLITDDPEIQSEVRVCLEQVERLTQVISDLLTTTKSAGGNAEAIHVLEIFNQQREEWEETFEAEGRELIFTDEAAQPVLASASVLSQVLATLIENSLRYGAGTTRVVCRKGTSSRGVLIDVSDEGEGIAEDMTDMIFEKGVSAHGSTGIGLPLARDLIKGTGGRLELTQAKPAVFTVSLPAMPTSLDPDVVMPEGMLVSVGRRKRRF